MSVPENRDESNDGLLVSKHILSNLDIYRCLRDARERRNVQIPVVVPNTNMGSFVAKRVIAVVWHREEDNVTRDSLFLEYHNIREILANANKDLLTSRQGEILSPEPLSSSQSEPGPSSSEPIPHPI